MFKPVAGSRRRQVALSLVEVVASTFIVSLMAVAALNSLGAATWSSDSIGNRAVALGLADELMSEIVQAAYNDPNQTPHFGREPGESNSLRSTYDDVDDYKNWNKTPPLYRDGTVIPDRADWRQRVDVDYVLPDDLTQVSGSDLGVKRIRVRIEYLDQVLVDQYAVRTDTDQ
jgi:type II secretory pathway pseudopilin PulG